MNEDDQLLDDNTILVPSTQMPTPLTFSTQMVRRFRLKSFTNQRGDAANPNNNTVCCHSYGPILSDLTVTVVCCVHVITQCTVLASLLIVECL